MNREISGVSFGVSLNWDIDGVDLNRDISGVSLKCIDSKED